MANDWDDRVDNFERKPVRTSISASVRVAIVFAVMVALALVVGGLFWAVRVGTSDVKGQGDAVITKNEAGNRIRAQEGFETRFQGIVAADKNLNITAEALKAQPSSVKLSTELNGQKMICADLVAQYNAKARSFSQQDFRAADLPPVIDESRPETDCKENSK